MTALITGASGGIGKDMAVILSKAGHDLILVARNQQKLMLLKSQLTTNVEIIALDLSIPDNCKTLFETVKDKNIDILINNAGYGIFGKFDETDLDNELSMINLNIKAVHILTKLFLKKFKGQNKGYILNVASSAAFLTGPLLSSYYASKAYILRLSTAISEELRKDNSKVSISVLCPGPVKTGFNSRAGVSFAIRGMNSYDVALYGLKNMFLKKLIIIPGILIKASVFASRFVSEKALSKICYHIQRRKK